MAKKTPAPKPQAEKKVEPAGPAHPGRIVLVDLDDGSEESHPFEEFPEAIAFAPTEGGPVPVVRIEIFSGTYGRSIRYLDAEGRRLREDVQF